MEPDDLYGLPLEEFTAARNALAKERPEAKGLRKPSAAAFAVNQLARRHASELDSFLAAAAELRRAQLRGGDIQAETKAQRAALQRLLQLAGEYAGAAQIADVRQTLQAAAADEQAAARVRAGTLERELEPAGFGSLLSGPPPRRPAGKGNPKPAAPKRDRKAERAAVEQARRRLREAKAQLREAEDELERTRAAVEAAEAELSEAERRAR